MTWEIAVGIFTMLAAFISVITAAVKINRAIVLLEAAVSRLNNFVDAQEEKNEDFDRRLTECDRRILMLEAGHQSSKSSRRNITAQL